jgi:hypothetical protein
MRKLEVFISHLTVESKFVDALRARLARDFIGLMNFFVSTDATSIPVGSQWFEGILTGLQRADLMFVVCSRESVKRPWINYETGGARVRNLEVIPLCHSGITPEQLPVPLSMSEGVLLTSSKDLLKLYTRIASMLGSDVPAVDFDAFSSELASLEAEYQGQLSDDASASQLRSGESIIEDPHVLCVSSEQYLQLGFENQLQTVLDAFPKSLRHDRVTTSRDLQRVLMTERVDIVHIAAFVCPRSGTLYFSPVHLPAGTPEEGEQDVVRADALGMLLKDAQTRLVVIASGDSLALATVLLPVTNVVAPRDIVSAKAMALWVQTFYTTLRVRSLAEACEFAGVTSRVSMKLLMQMVPRPSMKMTWQADDAPAGGARPIGATASRTAE